MASQNPPQYAEWTGSPQAHHSPQPAAAPQFSSFSGYGMPGVTVAPPAQPTPVLPSPIQQPAPLVSRPMLNTLEQTAGAGPVQAQHASHNQMAYQQRSQDVNEKADGQQDGCSQFMEGCAKITCATIVVTWAATIAACQLSICLMDCMSDSYYY